MEIIRLGSRESKLALVQTKLVKAYIEEHCPGKRVEIVTRKTTGDKILDRTLDQIGGKGLFVKELDIALREEESDLSIHSLKDLPMDVPFDLPLIGFSRREDPRDVLVLPKGAAKPNPNLPLGCSSRRRIVQLEKLFPNAMIKSIRGNVLTRLEKLDGGEYGGLILAAAGLKRLGLEDRITRYYTVEELIPAAGQGILALQGRRDMDYSFLKGFLDEESFYAATCERAFVRALDGGCSAPIAAYAKVDGKKLKLTGLYYNDDLRKQITGSIEGNVMDAERIGISLAKHLKESLNEV